MILMAALFTGLYYYLFLQGRYLYNRVDVGLWMCMLAVLLWTWKAEQRDGKGRRQPGLELACPAMVLAVMTACAFVQIPDWSDRLAARCVESRDERAQMREKMKRISKDSGNLYVSKLGILTASDCCAPFEAMPRDLFSNVALLGGWKVESAPYNRILEKYGFDHNPYEAITGLPVPARETGQNGAGAAGRKGRVLLLDEEPDLTLAYIREYYNPRAKMTRAGEWDGKQIWEIVTAEP